MTPRGEVIHISDGSGALEVRGNELACGLFLHGKPFVLNWADRAGSVGQEALLDTHTAEEAHTLLGQLTQSGPTEYITLQRFFAPLMRLFAPGTYGLAYGEPPGGSHVEWWDTTPFQRAEYYPYPHEIVLTLPETKVSDERVLEYVERVEQGERPFVVSATVPNAWCDFLIDGHHKLRAYYLLGIVPPWLRITALEPKLLTVADWPTTDLPRNFYDNVKPQWGQQ